MPRCITVVHYAVSFRFVHFLSRLPRFLRPCVHSQLMAPCANLEVFGGVDLKLSAHPRASTFSTPSTPPRCMPDCSHHWMGRSRHWGSARLSFCAFAPTKTWQFGQRASASPDGVVSIPHTTHARPHISTQPPPSIAPVPDSPNKLPESARGLLRSQIVSTSNCFDLDLVLFMCVTRDGAEGVIRVSSVQSIRPSTPACYWPNTTRCILSSQQLPLSSQKDPVCTLSSRLFLRRSIVALRRALVGVVRTWLSDWPECATSLICAAASPT
ncbi:hypothetical protein B0T19DRAFT_433347 [Cercophora scortea]|uniref:Uncharacterized protein n=1 Tax=Cercophora scortea TaxID=314031 RepID=A0AAE0I7X2_9PEZI|nr:hypothetical protein B0T19DRAFT_433347 [Cercophora scortea]